MALHYYITMLIYTELKWLGQTIITSALVLHGRSVINGYESIIENLLNYTFTCISPVQIKMLSKIITYESGSLSLSA